MNLDPKQIDTSTGLPTVPEGYYWDVTNKSANSGFVYGDTTFVYLMKAPAKRSKNKIKVFLDIAWNGGDSGYLPQKVDGVCFETEQVVKYADRAGISLDESTKHYIKKCAEETAVRHNKMLREAEARDTIEKYHLMYPPNTLR